MIVILRSLRQLTKSIWPIVVRVKLHELRSQLLQLKPVAFLVVSLGFVSPLTKPQKLFMHVRRILAHTRKDEVLCGGRDLRELSARCCQRVMNEVRCSHRN